MASLLYGSENFSTTLNVGGGIDSSQTTGITLASVSGLNTNGGMLGFTWASTIDTSTYEEIEYGGVSGNELTGVIRGQGGTSGKTHLNGATVIAIISKEHNNRIADKLRGVDATLATDTSGNEIIKTGSNASAVNEVTVTNAATGNAPAISATGGDTNIDLALTGKGTGKVKLSGLKYPSSDGTSGQVLQTDGSGNITFATSGSSDGWLTSSDTWVYASASTFTISGVDRTSVYTKGTRLKFTQTTTKYAVVVDSSFSTNTTVTIAVNTDYTIANAAITSPSYSYVVNPQGYPQWFNYTPVWTGFSADPGGVVAKFSVTGRICHFQIHTNTPGTSNSTSFIVTAPITNAGPDYVLPAAQGFDNGSYISTPCLVTMGTSSTTINVYKDFGGNTWTSSGGKRFVDTSGDYFI